MNRFRRGGSLIEVALSSLLVGVLLIGALNSVGARLRHQGSLVDRQRAALLAEQLLAEILEKNYSDPDEPPVFGPESSESGGTRAPFDDVDDYHGWDASPPQARDGVPLPNLAGWRRTVVVEYVKPDDLTSVAFADKGIKRITVEVYRDGKLLASRTTIRTSAWDSVP